MYSCVNKALCLLHRYALLQKDELHAQTDKRTEVSGPSSNDKAHLIIFVKQKTAYEIFSWGLF